MKRLLVVLSIFAVQGLKAQRSSDIIDYINTYKETAIREMQRSGVPASITLAQGIHESMAGKSDLVQRSNNHFGIKCRSEWKGEKVYHDDDARGECFRSYSKADESYVDHSDFLRNGPRYAFLFEYDPTDYTKWAHGLKKAGYATNPKYAQIIIKFIEDYNLQQYTLIAMGKLSPQDEVLAGGGKPVSISNGVAIREIKLPTAKPVVSYPIGEFKINRTKVIFAKAGTSLLGIAKQYDIALKHLLDFNELTEEDDDVLAEDQLIFLQRKRKSGEVEFHEVKPGETLYSISQAEGIRLENLISNNHLQDQPEPAVGEKLYLQSKAPERPKLATEVMAAATPQLPVVTPDQITPANSSAVTASLHIVREKETLYSIAKKYSITVEQLKEWNKLTGNDLKTGQELVIYKN
ncbi:glucosaminidase domain-containing protein [Longitalea arenae]|uniref:glucosaminidase domain-containing protein n=1 Tax=Longitalea arenae TaxID=2812558 RepID=UPI001967D5EF|nr:glucosaminidase domain-containing protein [Longitalea arenae]